MAKPIQTPLERTARLLDLVPYIASHQGVELSLLAKRFDVTQAQMVSDLTTLWMCGLPGYTPLELMDLSFDSGFVTIHNAQTLSKPRTLSDEESIALLLGLDMVIASLPSDREDLKSIALDLVERLSSRNDVASKLTAVPAVAGSVRAIVHTAVAKKTSVEIVYHSSYSDTISTRIIVPIELRQENGFEYLWGVCQSAHALRCFRLDRINSAKIVERVRDGSSTVLLDENLEIAYTIRTHSRPRTVMERFTLEKDALNSDAQVSSFSHEWIKRSVLASAGSVEVVDPASIRGEIAQAAQVILNRYRAD
ncbi:MAG: WYL domain-containing protein [Actinomycetota bacterium]|nr:WYL domain-containing protein [Actinomycetota bacterium]